MLTMNYFYCSYTCLYQSLYYLFLITGVEAVGVVTAVGPGVSGRKVGDPVAYAGNPMGAYAEEQILPAVKAVPLPPSIDPIVAASIMVKGMTTWYLVRQCFKVGFLFPHPKNFMFYRCLLARLLVE